MRRGYTGGLSRAERGSGSFRTEPRDLVGRRLIVWSWWFGRRRGPDLRRGVRGTPVEEVWEVKVVPVEEALREALRGSVETLKRTNKRSYWYLNKKVNK